MPFELRLIEDTPFAGDVVPPQLLAERQAADMFQALQNQGGVEFLPPSPPLAPSPRASFRWRPEGRGKGSFVPFEPGIGKM